MAPAADGGSDFTFAKMRVALAVILGTLFGSSVLPMMALGLLMLPMTAEFGWSRTAFSGGFTALMLAGAISAPILGRLVDRIGVRPMIIGGTVVVGCIVLSLSLLNGALWQFYAGFALLGFCGSTAIGYAKVIGALFTRHRGKALAIFGVESSLAGATAPLIVQSLITHFGWRGMFVGLGLIILCVVPIQYAFLREPAAPVSDAATGAPTVQPGLPLAAVLRTRTFWLIALAAVLAIGPAFGLMPHFVPFLVSRGFSAGEAAGLLSTMTVAMAAGTLAGGVAVDWAKGPWIAAPFSALSALVLMLFVFGGGEAGRGALVAGMALLGFAGGAKQPMASFFQLRFFGLRSFGAIVGVQSPFLAVGMGVSPLLVGWYYDRHATYAPVFAVMALAMAANVLIYLSLGRYRYTKALAEEGQAAALAEPAAPVLPRAVA
ncbi:MAG: MFS transporter [Sphingomonas fennica]